MSRVVCGIATMKAGKAQPGSSLSTVLSKLNAFVDEVIIVDGDPTATKEDYRHVLPGGTSTKYTLVFKEWTGSLMAQYVEILDRMKEGDWWLMLDDDEIPSVPLLYTLNDISKLKTGDLIDNKFRMISTPRITLLTDGNITTHLTPDTSYYTFFPLEKEPSKEIPNGPGIAGPRLHIFQYSKDLKFMMSPAGRHVVPYYLDQSLHGYILAPHYHLKSPHMYVYNDCVKAILDRDIKDEKIHNEYISMLHKNDIYSATDFYNATISNTVDQDFKDFCIAYKDHGAPQGRVFIWYYNILYPDSNPFPNDNSWKRALPKILSQSWRNVYTKSQNDGYTYQITNLLPLRFNRDWDPIT